MASSFYDRLYYLHWFSLLVTLFPLSFTTPVSATLCRNDERHALLQLKQSFSIAKHASSDPSSYPNVASWGHVHRGENASTSTDCCSWDGVECDRETGHVTGLDLSSCYLRGTINSSSTLFRLLHLQKLNLGDNDFSYSQIPSELRLLTRLTHLNLSKANFSGQIPLELAELSNLTSLDLGSNLLALHPSDLICLGRNLTMLQSLVLNHVNLSSTLPNFWANLSSLTDLHLSFCNLWGPIPTSIGDLTQLTYLDLAGNSLLGQIPSSFGNLKELTSLNLYENNLTGEIPSLINLTRLSQLDLHSNRLIGQISLWLSNLTQMSDLYLNDNRFHGTILGSIIASLVNLKVLDLSSNYLRGAVNFDIFLGLKNLTHLNVCANSLSLVNTVGSRNATYPKFTYLDLSHCHLQQFPEFLWQQDRLVFLRLDGNNIQGQIPKWVGDVLGKTLVVLILSDNYLTGFEQPSMLPSFRSLKAVCLAGNKIQGTLPIPPPSTIFYGVPDNLLTGEVSPWVCGMSSLAFLVLSSNNLSGTIPRCIGDISDSLLGLDLSNNSFSGSIPEIFSGRSALKMIDLSRNRLEGELPRSLANCKMLESLDLSENQISDTFPFWLGTLRGLRLLNLRSNQLFGAIESHKEYSDFPSLRILDLSSNNFTGILSLGFLQKLSGMKSFSPGQSEYMQIIMNVEDFVYGFKYPLILANKGKYLQYLQIPDVMAALDLSSNGFQGHIPPVIGTLKMIEVLNLSNNRLSGSIPPNLRDLTKLESMDLSNNMLSGEIPVQLLQLTFLEYFNVSDNQLEGSIPQGNQFNTFENGSYAGNSGLCGPPLIRKCGDPEATSPQQHPKSGKEHDGKRFTVDVDLMMVLMGYGSGLVVGLVIGHIFTTRKGGWFLNKYGSRQRTRT
uniref:Cf-4/9 disease resistance-like family protein n=1 Tax=Rhizophora mucronata TaxID=61149 RepID=A0A2P2MBT7_RHIMU